MIFAHLNKFSLFHLNPLGCEVINKLLKISCMLLIPPIAAQILTWRTVVFFFYDTIPDCSEAAGKDCVFVLIQIILK